MKIFGIAGTNGAGKDLVADMLGERHHFFVVSATEMLAAGLREKGWPIDREHKSKLSAQWRRQFGMAVVIDKAVQEFKAAKGDYEGIVVGSLRHPSEAERVHELGGKTVWIDADPEVRYARITTANRGANKASEDQKTYQEFLADQEREMHPTGDSATLNIAGVKKLCDIFIENNGDDIKAFKNEAQKALGL